MPRKDFMPTDDPGKCALFLHVRTNLPTFFGKLNIGPATPQVVTQAADALAFEYQCRVQQTLLAASQEATAAKNLLRDGDPANPVTLVSLPFPTAPIGAPAPVPPGVVNRFRAFTKWIKSLAGYTDDVGEALRLLGEKMAPVDLANAKPVLPLKIAGGWVEIGWGWEGFRGLVDSVEIHVDRGDGVWRLLTIDSRPGYVDTEPFAGPAKWRYKAIFRKDDQRVGLWSDVAEINVG